MKLMFLIIAFSFILFKTRIKAQTYGCTDNKASNYNSSASINDGSCKYENLSITPTTSFDLSNSLSETSGLISWNKMIWTHNDNTDNTIYGLDSTNGNIIKQLKLSNLKNIDWEEISQDQNYIYIGDFGNNASGNRKNLRILRIEKQSILANNIIADTINFTYSNQTDFSPKKTNNTDFDCEAFIVTKDSIYLFNKQWISNKTSLYSLPKTPGNYTACLKTTYDVEGLITGATYIPSKGLIILCGYSSLLNPFIYLLYGYSNADFFSGNKRKINIDLPFHQVEGICTSDGLHFYISNENFAKPPLINSPQKLHNLDLSDIIGSTTITPIQVAEVKYDKFKIVVYPNPALDVINVKSEYFPLNYILTDILGQPIRYGQFNHELSSMNIEGLPIGLYHLKFEENNNLVYNIIKR